MDGNVSPRKQHIQEKKKETDMKKLLALALCALLLVSLAACTRAPAADPQPESVVTESEPVQQPEPTRPY